ncbi:hypothetical protein HYPSUDRAFT_209218 [Hypholoma sublateritium FD-334 SS-4]|uniref:Uncharacterized protein n=1 Tax=Hypholoma sublateritium (strain FD-334 SS-4) TaxID=945553 RepID=A0A0D2NB96_HYPSF|nr:hypothetical protein HYPSUDRAFT_209218 [Hypholoma sublateritium FD-334 SS-4]
MARRNAVPSRALDAAPAPLPIDGPWVHPSICSLRARAVRGSASETGPACGGSVERPLINDIAIHLRARAYVHHRTSGLLIDARDARAPARVESVNSKRIFLRSRPGAAYVRALLARARTGSRLDTARPGVSDGRPQPACATLRVLPTIRDRFKFNKQPSRRLGATRAEATLADGIKCPAPTPHMRDRRSDGVIAR